MTAEQWRIAALVFGGFALAGAVLTWAESRHCAFLGALAGAGVGYVMVLGGIALACALNEAWLARQLPIVQGIVFLGGFIGFALLASSAATAVAAMNGCQL